MAHGESPAQQVLAQILEDPRTKTGGRFAGGHFTSRVYSDEPILMTGRAMVDALPEAYREARACARSPQAHGVSNAWLFYQQGCLLADLEDDAPYTGTFVRYFPTYQDLNDRQLRGYITWRTAVRAGRVEEVPATFMFLYAYEVLNGIGVAGPEAAFATLRAFWERYRALEPLLDRYLRSWLVDLVVYHGLDAGLVASDPLLNADVCWDGYLRVLETPEDATEHELFEAWVALSSYRFETSRFYKEHPADTQAVTVAVLSQLATYYGKHRKTGLHASLFGTWGTRSHPLFSAAVVYHDVPHPDGTYVLDGLRTYACSHGQWTCSSYGGTRDGRSRLGAILKAIDAALRRRWAFAHPLKQPKTPKYLEQIIERAIDARMAWNAAHRPRRIAIDRSKLGGIRSGAAQTCEALLVDEERFDEGERLGFASVDEKPTGLGECASVLEAPAGAVPAPGEVPQELGGLAAAGAAALQPEIEGFSLEAPADGFTEAERRFVALLLAGEAPADGGAGLTVDLLVDAVNEKLFDLLGDTAIAFDGAVPVLIDDYRDDVREAVAL